MQMDDFTKIEIQLLRYSFRSISKRIFSKIEMPDIFIQHISGACQGASKGILNLCRLQEVLAMGINGIWYPAPAGGTTKVSFSEADALRKAAGAPAAQTSVEAEPANTPASSNAPWEGSADAGPSKASSSEADASWMATGETLSVEARGAACAVRLPGSLADAPAWEKGRLEELQRRGLQY